MDILGKNNVRINFKKADSSSKEFAFMKAHELNNIEKLIKVKCDYCNEADIPEEQRQKIVCPRCKGYTYYYTKNIWRTGKNTNTQLIVETDNPSTENLSLIINHLQELFGYKFNAIKTLHGFHIIGSQVYKPHIDPITKKSLASINWMYANTLVLNNKITNIDEMQEVASKILDMDQELREYQFSTNYKNLFTTSLKNSGLLNCIGDFDVLYTILSLKYGKSTLRISKKQPEDKYEEVRI